MIVTVAPRHAARPASSRRGLPPRSAWALFLRRQAGGEAIKHEGVAPERWIRLRQLVHPGFRIGIQELREEGHMVRHGGQHALIRDAADQDVRYRYHYSLSPTCVSKRELEAPSLKTGEVDVGQVIATSQ